MFCEENCKIGQNLKKNYLIDGIIVTDDEAYFNNVAAILLKCHDGFNVLIVARFVDITAFHQTLFQ